MNTNHGEQSMNGKGEQKHVAKWTVMIYFAADNDLAEEAIADLKSMKKVGSTDKVNIIAQLDSRGRGNTFRFLLRDEQTTLDEDYACKPMPEINTGDPRELTDFIVWGMDTYKAENYMLVLWGHGSGPLELDQDNSDRAAAPTTDAVIYRDDPARCITEKKQMQIRGCYSVALTRQNEIRTFIKSETPGQKMEKSLKAQYDRDEFGRKEINKRLQSQGVTLSQDGGSTNSRGVGEDQTPSKASVISSEISQDVLKMDELEFALAAACERQAPLKNRIINILGMDACLMGTAEVGYQIKDHVEYLIASEDVILDEGWPYERILARLVNNPDMLPEEFSVTIIREFLLHYRDQNRDATKSACNLLMSDKLAEYVRGLAKELIEKLKDKTSIEGGITEAILASRAMAQSFYIKNYVDLYDFCRYLGQHCKDTKIVNLCSKLMNTIHRNETGADDRQPEPRSNSAEKRFVLDYGYIGHRLRGSNGVSIYFPCFNPSKKYAGLSFAEDTMWDEFLNALAERVPSNGPQEGEEAVPGEDTVRAGAGTEVKVERGMRQRMPMPLFRRKHEYPVTAPEEPETAKV